MSIRFSIVKSINIPIAGDVTRAFTAKGPDDYLSVEYLSGCLKIRARSGNRAEDSFFPWHIIGGAVLVTYKE